MDRLAILRKVETHPELRLVFKTNLNKHLDNWIKRRLRKKGNIIISITGKTGYGKSYQAIWYALKIAEITGVPFSLKNIEFEKSRLVELLERAKEGSTYILDEAGYSQFGEGSIAEEEHLRTIEQTVRKKQINLFYCSPVPILRVHHFVLEAVMPAWLYDKGNWLYSLVYDGNDSRILGYVKTGIPKINLTEYEKRKSEFIDQVLAGKLSGRREKWDKIIAEVQELPEFFKCRTKKDLKALLSYHYPMLSGLEIDTIVSLLELRLRE